MFRFKRLQLFGGGCQRWDGCALVLYLQRLDKGLLGRHIVAVEAFKSVVFEPKRQLAALRRLALALEREHLVPPLGVEDTGQERRAQNVAHLLAAHADLQHLDLLLGEHIALQDVDFVGRQGRDH